MHPDVELDVTSPQVITNKPLKGVLLRFEIVDQLPTGPQRSGKFAHLTMTPAAAMNLMLLLQDMKREHAIPDPPGRPQVIAVPPAKDRH